MTKLPSREAVSRLREQYPPGTRVELLSMDDPFTTLKPGDKGFVNHIDDTGTVFVDWDSGSALGLVYGVDSYKRIVLPIYERTAEFWYHLKEISDDLDAALTVGGKYISAKAKLECAEDEKQFCRELFAAMHKDTAGVSGFYEPIYSHDCNTAYAIGEGALFVKDRELNAACAARIDYLINSSQYKPQFYNLELAAMRAVHDYGFDRVNMVLARNIKARLYDVRFSDENKQWAQEARFAEQGPEYAVLNAHPVLLDGFAKYVRKLYSEVSVERDAPQADEKSSVMKQIRKAQETPSAPAGDKSAEKRTKTNPAER